MTIPPGHLILASASPRRQGLISLLGLPVTIAPSRYEEPTSREEPVNLREFVERLALEKANETASRCEAGWVIGADTEVSLEEEDCPLGKPADAAEAHQMLRRLSGRTHLVTTGVAILPYFGRGKTGEAQTFSEVTRVTFRPLTEAMIERYVSTGSPLDKAGAYGAQDGAALFIERYEGDFFNVVGLPVCSLARALEHLGVF